MRLLSTIIIALRALRRNKMRSTLTALGMIIGVGAVITTVSLGSGAKATVEAQIASLGQNLITVFPGNFTTGGVRGGWGSASSLTVEDAESIKLEVPGVIGASPTTRDYTQLIAGGLNWRSLIQGESADFPSIRAWPLAYGDFYTDQDVRTTAKVCVIGNTVAEQLYPGIDPIGQTLRVRNIPLRIVGVLSAKGFNAGGQDQDDIVIIPYTTAMKRVTKRDRISAITVQAQNENVMKRVQNDINDLLQQRRKGREPDYTVVNQIEIAEAANKSSETMRMLILAVAVVSLVVGGIGIMNIMLVSVTERTREIGIRMAVGAHGKDILLQFLTEAVVLSVLGGTLGILLGFAASQTIAVWKHWPVLVSTPAVVVSFAFSALIGIFFGFYPARKAAQLDPIDALRYE
ncbi:multidrug ABC transporter substrate-binding protein [Termitidicoccus mucosus]|uniref:Multidrug ABC transporter substrate-binding protein n=1 Tax=Termitidicoccus mucosus TaxID=1184151 RepID=A0A178ILF8_9BACT|nr:multidrug ABC transporter substrate-binding protein [Opitutaceae bacterium TSB47]